MTPLSPQQWVQLLQTQLQQSTLNGTVMDKNELQTDALDNKRATLTDAEGEFYWTLDALLEATEGVLVGPAPETVCFTSISTDSRNLQAGALYIAIKGTHFNGHDFAAEAVRQGAVAVLASEPVTVAVPCVQVADTRLALGRFAHWHRRQIPLKKLIAVTGSNGKTTTKSLLLELFSAQGRTLATEGNLNNDFGVPRTLLCIRPWHEYAIIEMGANHRLEIEYLTGMTEPDIALLNNASGAHLEGFGSLQGVIEAKGEIFQGLNRLRSGGVAVINTDSPGFDYWLQQLQRLGIEHVWSFGEAQQADVRLQKFIAHEQSIEFELRIPNQTQTVTMPLLGKHNAMNAAACVAVALAAGLDWAHIAPILSGFSGVAGRLQTRRLGHGWLIDDSYNANPASVRAAIDTLCALNGPGVLCLGAMAELGEQTLEAHREIARYAKQKGLARLFVLGEACREMPAVFGSGGQWFASHEDMASAVCEALDTHSVEHVLVKGSRSARMERLVALLVAEHVGGK
jgi:UDP-N-acetylmuramoyl-tripeptide--D-alanyl-D-alanine ligase